MLSLISHVCFIQYLHKKPGFPDGPSGKESACNAGDVRDAGSIPELEEPLEEGVATQFSILAWRRPWTEEPGGL